ncbi:MAG TPA: Rv2578c family radical SAM protein [Mycobacteriales bacterium]|nr:Rv2578c family radical SAM protein [Mycobacteriales bacterium]
MQWDHLRSSAGEDGALFGLDRVGVRTFDTPELRGMTFYEVRARSAINKVPAASRMPFGWTINPYRGCSHACVYCFARNTHTYLDLDAGLDFDRRVVVKVNTPELVRRELAGRSWRGEPIAMGTNVDCYQRAEGRYQLMPGVLAALRDAANPFSILTKGSLILRDLPLLRQAAEVTEVSTNVSVGFVDRALWRQVEPGTPSPARRLAVCATLNGAGVCCGVLMAPILPYLTDSPAALEATVRAIAGTGARQVSPVVLHLRPGAREWYMAWLARAYPGLVPAYERLYARGAYAPKAYQRQIGDLVATLAARYGIGRRGMDRPEVDRPERRVAGQAAVPADRDAGVPEQLALL